MVMTGIPNSDDSGMQTADTIEMMNSDGDDGDD